MKKKFVAIMMVAAMAASMAACGSDGGSSDTQKGGSSTTTSDVANKDKPLVWFNRQPSNSSTGELDTTALNYNKDTYYVGFDANQGAELQGEMVKEYIEKNIDTIDRNGDGVIGYVLAIGDIGHNDSIARTRGVRKALGTGVDKSGEIDSAPAGTNSDGKAAEVQDGKITVNGKDYVVRELASQEMKNSAGALSFPSKWSFSNFTEAMKVTDFWHSLGNSLLITIVTIVLAILIHSIAGYVIGRGMARKKSFRFIYLYIVSGMFVPFSILMMPLVKQTAQMGLGNRAGVIILYLVFYMPMNVLLYSGYLKNIPMALEEAADIDGASTWTTYWRVVFPMMKPMHATVAILTALGTWNDVMTPLVIMSGTGQNTLPLAQLNFQTQFGTNYNLAFASYILALIPILIFYIICQKQILNGVANGAVKG